jgi:hypothetical protein
MRIKVQFGEPRQAARPQPRPERQDQPRRAERGERDPLAGPRREGRRPAAQLQEIVNKYIADMSKSELLASHVTGSSVSIDEDGGEITLHIRGDGLVDHLQEIGHGVGAGFGAVAEQNRDLIGDYRIEMRVVYESASPRQSFHFTIDFDRPSRARRGDRPSRSSAADAGGTERPGRGRPALDASAAAHGQVDDSAEVREMPPVRLGIMPTYGESEGEGYEIAGVVEGGAAAKAGMKDGDRILSIGSSKISNVYEYMEALRKFKPGDMVPVTVLRDGKRVELKVKAEGPMVREAA